MEYRTLNIWQHRKESSDDLIGLIKTSLEKLIYITFDL